MSINDLTIGWQNLNQLSHPNTTLAPQARQARTSGENLNYLTIALQDTDILSMIISINVFDTRLDQDSIVTTEDVNKKMFNSLFRKLLNLAASSQSDISINSLCSQPSTLAIHQCQVCLPGPQYFQN